jgi:hypothetical protein
MNTNDCRNPQWSRSGGDPLLKRTTCTPPDYEVKSYPFPEGGGESCIGFIVPAAGLCLACVVAFVKFSEPDSSGIKVSAKSNPDFEVFVSKYYESALTVESNTGIPAVILLSEALVLTAGKTPEDNDIYGSGKAKSIYRSFLNHAKSCAARFPSKDEIPTDPAEYIEAATKLNIYNKAGAGQVKIMVPTVQNLLK